MPHDHDISGPESDKAESRAPRGTGPGTSSEALSLLELQAAAGNQAVSRMLGTRGRGTATPPSPPNDAVKVQRDGLEDSLRTQSGNTTINWDEFAQRLLTIVNRPANQSGSGTQSGSGSQSTSGSGSGLGGGTGVGHRVTEADRQLWAAQEQNEMRRLMGLDPLPLPQTGATTGAGAGGRGATPPTPHPTGNAPTTTPTTTPTTGNAPTTTPTTTPTTGNAPTTTGTTQPTVPPAQDVEHLRQNLGATGSPETLDELLTPEHVPNLPAWQQRRRQL